MAEERSWAHINSTQNSVKPPEYGGAAGEESDALSFCDLPLINHSRKQSEKQSIDEIQEDFDFCSLSKESQMCAADEVFYQGQILPLNFSRSISRSKSMDQYSSGGLISSRSSSISSRNSFTSGSGNTAVAAANDLKLQPRNQFHSQPSSPPRIRFQSRINSNNCAKKSSSPWNLLRLGLITTPPEIAFQNVKNRHPIKHFRSHNSTSCSSSDKKKNKQRALLGGCKCSFSAVDTIPSKVAIINRSASKGENLLAMKTPRKGLFDHRTFEWLKQLSIEGAAEEP